MDLASLVVLAVCQSMRAQGGSTLDPTEEITQFLNALDENPTSITAHMDLGAAYVGLRALVPAAEMFEKVLRLDPSHAAAYYYLGGTLYLQERYDAAIEPEYTIHLEESER